MSPSRILVCTLCAAPLGCEAAPSLAITPAAALISLDGEIGAAQAGDPGTTSFEALGLGGTDTATYPRADLGWLGMNLSLTGLTAEFEGRGTLAAPIAIDGGSIPGGTEVDTQLTFRTISAVFSRSFFEESPVQVGLGLGFTLLDLDLDMRSTSGPETVTSREALPIPVLAGRLAWTNWPFNIGGTLGAISLSYADYDLTVLDLDVYASMDFLYVAQFVAGYRLFDVDGIFDTGSSTVALDARLSGPYVGLRVAF